VIQQTSTVTGANQNYQADLLGFMRQQRCGYNPFLDMVCHQRDGRTAYKIVRVVKLLGVKKVITQKTFFVILFCTYVVPLSAAPVAIVNHGFEDIYLGGNLPPQYEGDVPATAFPVGAAPNGWSPYGAVGAPAYIGVLNPGVMVEEPLATYFPTGAPEGENVALTFFDGHQGGAEFGIQQTLSAILQLRTRYTLTVEVGNIASGISVVQPYAGFGSFDLRGFTGYRIDLLAGETILASDNNSLLPDEGIFLTSSFDVVIGTMHDDLNEPLTIRLVNLNVQDVNDPVVDLEVDFDNVHLDASPLASADFDADGDVDGDDLSEWQNAYASSGGADADEDADSDGADFLIWQRQYTGDLHLLSPAMLIPEPTSGLHLLAAGLLITVCRSTRA
jgi:hapalindole H/12-epi-hapalindole U/12-epi-fischerindole U synthase